MPGFAAAAVVSAIGGPMQDIPTAVLRQTRLAARDRAAAMRAYMAMSGSGILIAMLLIPAAIGALGITRSHRRVRCGLSRRGGGRPGAPRRVARQCRGSNGLTETGYSFFRPNPAKRLLNFAT